MSTSAASIGRGLGHPRARRKALVLGPPRGELGVAEHARRVDVQHHAGAPFLLDHLGAELDLTCCGAHG